MKLLTTLDWADIGERALATAIQAFLAAVPVSAIMELDKAVIIGGLMAAIGAALSVVKNVLKQWLDGRNAAQG